MDINPTLSVITLRINGLNTSIKKTKIGRMDFKQHNLTLCCLQVTQFKVKDENRLKVKMQEKIYKQQLEESLNQK